MRIHEVKPATRLRSKKRIGRGGAHGTYSTRGIKGQKSRSGAKIRPGFEGGRTPLKKLLPKKRGVGFKKLWSRATVIDLDTVNRIFKANEIVNQKALIENKIIKDGRHAFKILANGNIDHPLVMEKCNLSKGAREKIIQAGGKVV